MLHPMITPLAFHLPFLDEWMVIAFFGLLIFGKRLPEVGRSIGKGIVEFKKGLAGIEDEINVASTTKPVTSTARPVLANDAAQYKFDPATGEAIATTATQPTGAKFDPYTGKPISNEVVTGEVVGSSAGNG